MNKLFYLVGLAFLCLAILFVFWNGGLAFQFFVVGVGLIVWYFNTPEGKLELAQSLAKAKADQKAAIEKAEVDQKAAIEFDKSLQIRFQ